MKPAVEYKIVPATLQDKELFFWYLKKYFYEEEPMHSSINFTPESADELLVLNCLSHGLSFKAVDESENTLGVVLNIFRTPSLEENHQERLKKSKNPVAYAKILKALETVEHGSDFWNKTKVDKAFHTDYLATTTEFRGLNIGKKLMQRSLDLAKSLNFEYATIECSSYFSAKIAADFGYESYYELVYNDHKDSKNNIIFDVKPPHTGMSFCVKKL